MSNLNMSSNSNTILRNKKEHKLNTQKTIQLVDLQNRNNSFSRNIALAQLHSVNKSKNITTI